MLENASVSILSRRSIFTGLKLWLYGLFIMIIICLIWHKYYFLGDIYIYTFFPLAVFNIVCFLQKYYLITIRTKSGKEYYRKCKNKSLLEEISCQINAKIENVNISKEKSIIVNNGIINKGNNNTNISNSTNYQELVKELIVLSNYIEDKEKVNKAIDYAKNKDDGKLTKTLKKMGKGIICLVKDLGLVVLEKYLENIFFN